MRGVLVVIYSVVIYSVMMLVSSTAGAQDIEQSIERPRVELRAQIGSFAYRSSGCACLDRYLWGYTGGVGVQFHRFFTVEGGYHYGTMVFPEQAEVAALAVSLGWKTALTRESGRWWDGFFGRLGYQRLWVNFTRESGFNGAYGGVGFRHGLGFWQEYLQLEYEVPVTLVRGALSHTTAGIRGGVVVRW